MTDWHASEHQVIHYADGSLPEPDAWSLEKHLESCGACAQRVSHAVRRTAAGVALAGIREAVLTEVRGAAAADVPESASVTAPAPVTARASVAASVPVGAPASLTASASASAPASVRSPAPVSVWRSLRSAPVRALWAMGPAVRGAWLPAVLLVAVGAVALAHAGGLPDARPWLLALAPVVPVAGVALSYGPHADPMHEIVASTPSAGLRLVLMRTATVLAVSLPLLTLAGVMLPSSDAPNAAAWLLPGLALTLASLALACCLGLRTATLVTGGGWLSVVFGPLLAAPGERLTAQLSERLTDVLAGAPAQGAWAAAATLCAAVLAVHRPSFRRLEKS
ncbi:zf-HC2 domain-containing protein [Streptomyces sp. 15-116A]|uniref:zf-HC2 domain-containing protein n=1 Tax=Streptomyces sp. 15-116A TaxID=2259035 RepID=UPI0021B1E812|nr:zf-HC2 domain-containing protein [Streptomyces sp. 15-116A]MCT7354413.1 zf-HC2 domain-containing protein [Streptomyces sp. 15-116A]